MGPAQCWDCAAGGSGRPPAAGPIALPTWKRSRRSRRCKRARSKHLIKAEIDVILLDGSGRRRSGYPSIHWMNGRAHGGVLIRFRRPAPCRKPRTRLTPVPLRAGGRALGGPMSWSAPLGLAPSARKRPAERADAARWRRRIPPGAWQSPDQNLAAVTWAALADGTPLVTGGELGARHPGADPRGRRARLVRPADLRLSSSKCCGG